MGWVHAPVALPRGKRLGTHCTGCWMGPRVGLYVCSYRDSISGPSCSSQVAVPTTLSRPTLWPRKNNHKTNLYSSGQAVRARGSWGSHNF